MESKVKQLFDKYEPRCVIEAGELLFTPEDALSFLQELELLNMPIYALGLWYKVSNNIAEDPSWLDLGALRNQPDRAKVSIEATRKFIMGNMPSHISYVSFFVDDDDEPTRLSS
jgi:hypothetical protein